MKLGTADHGRQATRRAPRRRVSATSRGRPAAAGALALATLLSAAPGVAAQDGDARTLDAADYGRFERLGAFALDPTGRWLVTSVTRVDETRELRLHLADGTGETLVLEHGSDPVFGGDGRWMAYRRGSHPDVDTDSVPDRLGLVNLDLGADTVLFPAASYAFRDDGAWLAVAQPAAADTVGADLVLLRPGVSGTTVIGNVDTFTWQDEGTLLAATSRTASGETNGVIVFDPDAGTLRTIESGDARYRAPTWREGSNALAVLRSVDDPDREGEGHDILLWRDVTAEAAPLVLGARTGGSIPDTLRVSDAGGIAFADDGATVFVGLSAWPARPAADTTEGAADTTGSAAEVGPADVQVWHWDDDRILRAQEYAADRDARRTLAAAWHVDDGRLVVLGDDPLEEVERVAGGRWGVVPDYEPYRVERRFGSGAADWYRVDPATGARALIAEGAPFGIETHPDAEHVLVYADDHWSVISLATLERTPVGDGHGFTRSLEDYDYPGPRPSWGVGAWIRGAAGSSAGSTAPAGSPAPDRVLLYDRHDVWAADLGSGALERLTDGGPSGRRYRVSDVRPDRSAGGPTTLEAGDPIWLSVRDLRTKASGYARLDAAAGTSGASAETLLWEDALVTGLVQAQEGGRMAVRMERWDDAPDVFVADQDLADRRQITRINPFQDDIDWGRTELVDYTTDAGHDLQAVLVYPADFEEGRRYPLILYQYERLSDDLHRYDVPSEREYYDFQTWSQRGYFVLRPDILYEPGRPGPSALDAVEHALDAAIATGHVDPDRLGLIGHSWGGYQATYLPTRTDRFAASVAGAPITNFLSFMGAVHWNGGLPETGHWETGQARMAAPYWEDFQGHLESSPAHGITDLETPLLIMHGDADGVVDFRQGLEFYNYARRAGKEVVLLVYPGADHGLTKEEHQVDYHRRILEWFDHHLKGAPAAPWIVDGENWQERARRIGDGGR